MIDDKLDYKFLKVKNGILFFAVINLEISKSDNGNEIIEEYLGEGWKRQGSLESVPVNGYEDWKKAVKNGLEFAFTKSAEKWRVKIKKVEGMTTDTNPTIVGFAAIVAFCEQTNTDLSFDTKAAIENFTFKSWENKNCEKVPDFINLGYYE